MLNLFFSALTGAIGAIASFLQIKDAFKLNPQKRNFMWILIASIFSLTLILFYAGASSLVTPALRQGNNPTSTIPQSSTGNTATQTLPQQQPTAPPTPTPIPNPAPNTVLYQADQSWSGWSGSSDWKIVNGMLVNNGSGGALGPTILAPYELGNVSDYAVEATIQVVHWNHCCYSLFAIVARAVSTSAGSQGYSFQDDVQASAVQVTPSSSYSSNALTGAPFDPGSTPHTYRVEVKGNSLKLFIDGGPKFDIADNSYSSGGQVGLWSYGVQLNISSFKIIAL